MRDFGKYRVIAKNNVNWPPEDGESRRIITTGVFSVIPADLGWASGAGAGMPARGEGPSPSFGRPPGASTRDQVRGDHANGGTVLANRQKHCQLV